MREGVASKQFQNTPSFLKIIDDRGCGGDEDGQGGILLLEELSEEHESFRSNLCLVYFVHTEHSDIGVCVHEANELVFDAWLLECFIVQHEIAVGGGVTPVGR